MLENTLFKDCPVTFKYFFIKEPVSKIHIKFTAFYEHLSLKVQDWVCHEVYFESCGSHQKLPGKVPGRFWMCAPNFKRVLHVEIHAKFRCEHCSFKVWVQWCCSLWKYIVEDSEISFFTCICLHLQSMLQAKLKYFDGIQHFQR